MMIAFMDSHLCFEHYYVEPVEEIYSKERFKGSIIDNYRFVETDQEKAKRVEKAIREKFSDDGYMALYRTFYPMMIIKTAIYLTI